MALHDPEAGLLPANQRDLSSRLTSSNAVFRATARQRENRPLIIQRVPQSVRALDELYFVPEVVSFGPYHHRAAQHLVEMEAVKEAVVHDFCCGSSRSSNRWHTEAPAWGQQQQQQQQVVSSSAVERFLQAVRPVVPEARLCYADQFDRVVSDSDFTNMMVVDGCFLLAVVAILTNDYPHEHSSWAHGRMLRIMKDMMLFENQVPWVVMDALMALRPVLMDEFVAKVLAYLDVHQREPRFDTPYGDLRPAHLLDLVHKRHLGGGAVYDGAGVRYCDYTRPFPHFTSAVELAEAGIRIHGSGTCRVREVRVEPAAATAGFRIGRLALPQLVLSWLPRCWLINMVALECVTDRSDHSGVSSYLAILGSLISAESDVRELRSRRILFSTISDRRTVEFFQGLLDQLPRQELYLRTLESIVELRTRRSTRSRLHAVYYRNRRIILAAAPLLSLLVAIIGIALTNSLKRK